MGCPEPDTFNALVSGQLDPDARAALFDHAADCDECHGMIDALLEATVPSQPRAPAAPVGDPDRVGRYVIERRLGAGAMGVVYAARDPELERRVAIKVLRGGGSPARLKREAQMLARLQHPNVVAVYDVGEHDGQTFVAMALVDGENLRAWLGKPHPTDEIVRVIRDAAAGLAAAHAAELVHRDLKPDNIFVAHDGSVQVGDFGLARSDGELDPAASASGELELTQTGMVLGTPAYMAPEHAAGEPTPASDQFSFCVTAWEALYGVRPFAAKTYAELRERIEAHDLVAPPEPRRVPARVRAALERGLAADPARRFPSIAALRAALAPPRARWPWLAGGAGALALAAVAAMIAGSRSSHRDDCAGATSDLDDVALQLVQPALVPGQPVLDNYTRDWRALRREVCVAGAAVDDPRVACLARAREALRELAAGAGSAAGPDAIHAGVLALPPLADCRTALAGSATIAQLTGGGALLQKIETAHVRASLNGAPDPGTFRELAKEADASGFEPAIAAAALALGWSLSRSPDLAPAAAALGHGLSVAEENHDDHGVATIAAQLAPLLVMHHRLDEALAIINLGDAALVRAGGDPSLEVDLVYARARLAAANGDHAAAIELLRKSIAPITARAGSNSAELGTLELGLADEYIQAGRYTEAQQFAERAQAAFAGHAKLGGFDNVVVLGNKINEAFIAGDAAHTIELAHELIALARELHEPSYELDGLLELARAYELADDGHEMVTHYQAVLDALDKQPKLESPDMRGAALEGVGRGWLLLDQPERAIAPLRRAVETNTAAGPVLADETSTSTLALADALIATGNAHEARGLVEPLVRRLADDTQAPLQRLGGAQFALARALWDDGAAREHARARMLAAEAESRYQAALAKAKAPGGMPAVVPHLQQKLDAIVKWRALRQ